MRHEKIKHLDLFSGIGGFALALEEVFGKKNVEHTFCDIEPFAQAILRKHWPNSIIHDDIKTLTADAIYSGLEGSERKEGSRHSRQLDRGGKDKTPLIDILTGGFPCQPFSAAGRRKGTADDRHLWPEMLRVIRETNPSYILGENVGGLLTWDGGMVLEMVLSDLEAAGYEAGAFIVPACAVGAPHRRDRVWIAAHAIGSDARRASRFIHGAQEGERLSKRNQVGKFSEPSEVRDAANTECESARDSEPSWAGKGASGGTARPDSQWREDWPQVAAQLCTLDDGLPDGLARPRGWRNAALKGAGNAIVPQVAAQIIKAMMEA